MVLEDRSDGVRTRLRSPSSQLGKAGGLGEGFAGVPSLHEQLMALGGGQQGQLVETEVRCLKGAREQEGVGAHQAVHGGGVEEVRIEGGNHLQVFTPLPQVEFEVEGGR